MIRNLQPNNDSCFGTAVSCILECDVNQFYAYTHVPKYEAIHHEVIVRTLLKLGRRPVTLEFASSHDGVNQVDTGDFWQYFTRGVLIAYGQHDMHAYAYDGGKCWNPNGRNEDVTTLEIVYGIDF